jgi:ADP-heptose:LPS heptosyltransferase/predicted SAM-dependent methyltransferase
MVWRIDDPCGDETGKIRWELVPYTRGRGLDLGCGPSKAFDHFIGVDNYTDTQLFGIQMKPDVVCNVTKLDVFGSASMDFVYSSHCLEHIAPEKVESTLKEWMRVVKPSGYLLLYLPDEDEYPKCGEEGANPDHKWNVNYERVVTYMKAAGSWELVRFEKRNQGMEYSLFFVFKKRTDGKHLFSHDKPRPEKKAAIARYGAIGDAIQASSLFPGLKEQGFHVTVYCNPRTHEVLQHDPNVDEFYIQDTDQVPNHLLGEFWKNEAAKFDRWINLSETVEGALLALPGRTAYMWPQGARHKALNHNYMELAHEIAQVPLPVRQKFYPSPEEKAWAKKERAKFGGDFLVMYSLSGSSVHKVWPYMDGLIARIMITMKDARVVTVGDGLSTMLEAGWENEPRLIRKSGKYTIRETLSLLEECDMVIGPETGVLNAAANLSVPKVVFLSHSSSENLTKHWVNTKALEPKNTECFPCHRLIYEWSQCNRDDSTGVAKCASDIGLEDAWEAVQAFIPSHQVALPRKPVIRLKEVA